MIGGKAHHSLKSPACSCSSITLPASSYARITASCDSTLFFERRIDRAQAGPTQDGESGAPISLVHAAIVAPAAALAPFPRNVRRTGLNAFNHACVFEHQQ